MAHSVAAMNRTASAVAGPIAQVSIHSLPAVLGLGDDGTVGRRTIVRWSSGNVLSTLRFATLDVLAKTVANSTVATTSRFDGLATSVRVLICFAINDAHGKGSRRLEWDRSSCMSALWWTWVSSPARDGPDGRLLPGWTRSTMLVLAILTGDQVVWNFVCKRFLCCDLFVKERMRLREEMLRLVCVVCCVLPVGVRWLINSTNRPCQFRQE